MWAREMRSQPMEVAFRGVEVVERDILAGMVWFGLFSDDY